MASTPRFSPWRWGRDDVPAITSPLHVESCAGHHGGDVMMGRDPDCLRWIARFREPPAEGQVSAQRSAPRSTAGRITLGHLFQQVAVWAGPIYRARPVTGSFAVSLQSMQENERLLPGQLHPRLESALIFTRIRACSGFQSSKRTQTGDFAVFVGRVCFGATPQKRLCLCGRRLDGPTGLKTGAHIFFDDASDYYRVHPDENTIGGASSDVCCSTRFDYE